MNGTEKKNNEEKLLKFLLEFKICCYYKPNAAWDGLDHVQKILSQIISATSNVCKWYDRDR